MKTADVEKLAKYWEKDYLDYYVTDYAVHIIIDNTTFITVTNGVLPRKYTVIFTENDVIVDCVNNVVINGAIGYISEYFSSKL